MYECRCDERLKTNAEESTRPTHTGLLGELEHLKIKTRLIDEKFAKVLFFLCSSGLFLFLFAEGVFSDSGGCDPGLKG